MNQDLVRQLIVGSQEIDSMRKEVVALVAMVLGLIRESDIRAWKADKIPSLSGHLGQVFRSPECEWTIELNDSWRLDATCDLIFQVCHPGDARTPRAYDSFRPVLRTEHVQKVHACLPVFVNAMAEAFPELSVRWQPFLKAAECRS